MMISALKAQWAGVWDDGNTTEQDLWLVAQNKNFSFSSLSECVYIYIHAFSRIYRGFVALKKH